MFEREEGSEYVDIFSFSHVVPREGGNEKGRAEGEQASGSE